MTFKRIYVRCMRDIRLPICICMLPVMVLMAGFIPNRHVTIAVDGQVIELKTPYRAPANILTQAGVAPRDKDVYLMTADANGDDVLTVTRAASIIIDYNGSQQELLTNKTTVGEAVKELGYVGNGYQIVQGEDATVVPGMVVQIKEVPAPAPQNTVETEQGALTYSHHFDMEATAYIPSDGDGAGITATGIPARRGVVAVDPDVIPLGSRVYIPGYGVAIAADTGGAIRGNRIDLCMETYREAINFGRGSVEVYVLD